MVVHILKSEIFGLLRLKPYFRITLSPPIFLNSGNTIALLFEGQMIRQVVNKLKKSFKNITT